jgi:H+-translocating NAD(P) transhydrogenase subunit alpha
MSGGESVVGSVYAAISRKNSVFSTQYSVLGTSALGGAIVLFAPALVSAQQPQHANPSSSDLPSMLFVFMLATFIGLGVITRVSRLLHTPLMSITNAISAIAIVGAIAVAGSEHPFYINLLGAIALFASTTNIVSGFLITDRMLKMFKRA